MQNASRKPRGMRAVLIYEFVEVLTKDEQQGGQDQGGTKLSTFELWNAIIAPALGSGHV